MYLLITLAHCVPSLTHNQPHTLTDHTLTEHKLTEACVLTEHILGYLKKKLLHHFKMQAGALSVSEV